MFSQRHCSGPGSLLLAICCGCCALLAAGCGDDGPTHGSASPPSWTATATDREHAKARSEDARKAIEAAAAEGAKPGDRQRALRMAAITAEPVPASLRPEPAVDPKGADPKVADPKDSAAKQPVPRAPWEVRSLALSIDYARREGRPAAALTEMLTEPAIASDPLAAGVLRNNHACTIVDDALLRSLSGPELAAALGDAAREFSSVCQVPEAAMNEASCLIALARLQPEMSADHLRAAAIAMARLDSDALTCPMVAGEFLGVVGHGDRIAFVLDSSLSMAGEPLAVLKAALIESIRALAPTSSFMVWFFGDDAVPMSVPADAEIADGLIVLGKAGPSREHFFEACRKWIAGHGQAGDTFPLAALKAAAATHPSTLFLVTDGKMQDPPAELRAVADQVAADGGRIDVVLLIRSQHPTADESTEDLLAIPRELASRTNGSLRVIDADGIAQVADFGNTEARISAGLSGETMRERAKREGRWTPAVERQYRATRSLLALVRWLDAKDRPLAVSLAVSDAKIATDATAALSPDPVIAAVGLPRQDWQLLMIEAAVLAVSDDAKAPESFDAKAPESFLEAASLLATAAAEQRTAGNPADAARLDELAARAVLLSCLSSPSGPDDAALQKASADLASLGIVSDTWSARLLGSMRGAFANAIATRGLDPARPADAAALRELDAIRLIGGRAPGKAPPDLSHLPVVDRVVFEKAIKRASAKGGAATP
jgi:hypothetical protein